MKRLARGLARVTLSMTLGSLFAFLLAVMPSVTIPEAVAQRMAYVTQDIVGLVWTPYGFQGSGVAYSDGVVLTARHVVGKERKARIIFDAEQVDGEVSCMTEPTHDFAVLTLKNTRHTGRTIQVSLTPVVPGQVLMVAGYEMGKWISYATVVKYIAGAAVVIDNGTVDFPEIIVVEHRSNGPGFGMSGGGAFDAEGRLVGIICCARQTIPEVGIVPIHRGLLSCKP